MTPEEAARRKIDELLTQAGWDYLLFIDREAVGAIEAKPEGTTLSGVEEQTGGYLSGLPEEIPHVSNPLPFGYDSTDAR